MVDVEIECVVCHRKGKIIVDDPNNIMVDLYTDVGMTLFEGKIVCGIHIEQLRNPKDIFTRLRELEEKVVIIESKLPPE